MITYKNVDGLGGLLARMPVRDAQDFVCLIYDDNVAEVGTGDLRVQRLPSHLKEMHADMQVERNAEAYLCTDDVLGRKYLTTVAHGRTMPVRATAEEVAAVEKAYWDERCARLEVDLATAEKSEEFIFQDPMTGHEWKAWDLIAAGVMSKDDDRTPHVAYCEATGDQMIFDLLDDGLVQVMVRPGDDDDVPATLLEAMKFAKPE